MSSNRESLLALQLFRVCYYDAGSELRDSEWHFTSRHARTHHHRRRGHSPPASDAITASRLSLHNDCQRSHAARAYCTTFTLSASPIITAAAGKNNTLAQPKCIVYARPVIACITVPMKSRSAKLSNTASSYKVADVFYFFLRKKISEISICAILRVLKNTL